jgi:predicted ATPase
LTKLWKPAFRVDSDSMPGWVSLAHSDWDDWFEFATMYYATYIDTDGGRHEIGNVKIGEFGLQPRRAGEYAGERGFRSPTLERRFHSVDTHQFSLGQDTSYYENLTKISAQFRRDYLKAMNDLARDRTLFESAQVERVTRTSLLRDVPPATVRDQFARLAVGMPRLTPYDFAFTLNGDSADVQPFQLKFSVQPRSRPPTNIHVLIGRNGVGKSTTLDKIAKSVVEESRQPRSGASAQSPQSSQLANVVSVSFSAFDSFDPLPETRDRSKGLTYHYVGLRKKGAHDVTPDSPAMQTKDLSALAREMRAAAKTCLVGARRKRWRKALDLLGGDPLFGSLGLTDLISASAVDQAANDDILDSIGRIFRLLSSGHKVVLLSMTKLVATVEERSLVLLDEPEAHLHPPLLSAFVRALSDLLTDRNGLAIIATHSPVVLQEVPKSCVWRLQRYGKDVTAERPTVETFGENVGTLTNEVFGLEVRATGFHTMLAAAAMKAHDYESALAQFRGQLGGEGRLILRAMMNVRDNSVEH